MYLFYKPVKTLGLKCRENKRETKKNHLDKQLWLFVKDSGANRVQICSTFTFTCKIVLTELEKVRLASRVSSALSYVVQSPWSEWGLPGYNRGQSLAPNTWTPFGLDAHASGCSALQYSLKWLSRSCIYLRVWVAWIVTVCLNIWH